MPHDDPTQTVRIIPLGGIGEIGLNCAVFETSRTRIVVDCGLMFPHEAMFGVEIVVPDLAYLKDDRPIDAILLTHGHEDHIGAVPYLIEEKPAPIYGTRFTLGLVRSRLAEHGVGAAELREVTPGEQLTIGDMVIEFLGVTHSIVDACGIAITTPAGTIIHTGDFKIDPDPDHISKFDMARFAHYGDQGVSLLMSDSTNAERTGHTLSEHAVESTLEKIFEQATGRIFIAVFASHIPRIRQILQLSQMRRRRVALEGRSMLNNVRLARETGHLQIPGDLLISSDDAQHHSNDQVVVLCTGSQAEPTSALLRIATGSHKKIKLRSDDTVILSSRFIPGNERAIGHMINTLYRHGVDVHYQSVSRIHTSGHAHQEELRAMLALTRPAYLFPIHGEVRMLTRHARLGQETGLPKENTFVIENGRVLEMCGGAVHVSAEVVDTGKILIDTRGEGGVGAGVVADRRQLGTRGVIVAMIALDTKTGSFVRPAEIFARGVLPEDRGARIQQGATDAMRHALEALPVEGRMDPTVVREEAARILQRYFRKTLQRRPVVVPVVVEI